jgi:glyoxylase-like metal-dependent hydrolase (beta-lactamase superfamily II)
MRKSVLIRAAAAIFLLSALWVAYTQSPPPSKLDTVKLADDLYVIHNDYVPGNSTALVTNEGVILVDDKFPTDYNNILAEIKKFTNQPVRYVVNTHHHGDHSGGNELAQKMGAVVVANQNALANMIDANQPGVANIGFKDHAVLRLGGKTAELFYFGRSHTNGDTVVLFPAQRTLAAGDMFTYGDATPELIDYAGGGSAKEWPQTLAGALQLDFDTVVPGHGVVTKKAEMAKFRESTITLNNRVRQLVREEKSRDEIAQVMMKEFHWEDLHIQRGLDGAMVELQ